MPLLKETVAFRVEKTFEMPSIPLVLTKIIQVLDDEKASARELEDLILHDPSLSVRILKLANSAFYSFRSEVKTISHAIALLGITLVKSLAIGVHIFDSFTKGMKSEAVLINQLWMHSFAVALLAQEIWKTRTSRKEAEFAFLCGLLHDMGKVVYFIKDPASYGPLFSEQKGESDADISTLEMEYYGIDHAALGSMLAKRWDLPLDLATVIGKHHGALTANDGLVVAVSLADGLAKEAGIGYDGDRKSGAQLDVLQAKLSMSAEELAGLRSFAIAKIKDVEEFFRLS